MTFVNLLCHLDTTLKTIYMKIVYGNKSDEIKTLADWKNHLKSKWVEGRSTWMLGHYVVKNEGISKLERIIKDVISEEVKLEKVYVEKSVKFDKHPRHSMRDLVIVGKANDGKQLFVTVEAKASEDFGPKLSSVCEVAEKAKDENHKSERIDRIKELYKKLIIKDGTCENSDLRYQLLHATAATATSEDKDFKSAEYRIMIVLEFKKDATKNCLKRNKEHFIAFMCAIKAKPIQDKELPLLYESNIEDKEIKFVYIEI